MCFPVSVVLMNSLPKEGEALALEPDDGNENVCTMCERLITEALDLLAENRTQKLIIEMLHATCSEVQSFKQQVVTSCKQSWVCCLSCVISVSDRIIYSFTSLSPLFFFHLSDFNLYILCVFSMKCKHW